MGPPPKAPFHDAMDLRDDRSWLDAFRRGEHPALERVFRAYAPLAFAVVRRRLAATPGVSADDVVQDVFIRLFSDRARAQYDGIRPFGALVRVVAGNTCVDHLRKLRPQEVQSAAPNDEADFEQWMPGAPLPDDVLVNQQQKERAQAFLADLPQDQRALFQLRFQQQMSQLDAARALGLSRQSARTLETRLREQVERFLARWR